jgi:hypothetical protein
MSHEFQNTLYPTEATMCAAIKALAARVAEGDSEACGELARALLRAGYLGDLVDSGSHYQIWALTRGRGWIWLEQPGHTAPLVYVTREGARRRAASEAHWGVAQRAQVIRVGTIRLERLDEFQRKGS